MTKLSKVLLIVSAILLAISIFVPLWRIELDAPQYPEGLVLQIFPNKLGGQVEIINGLNHYIGMGTLHAENFIEFTVLPYIIGFFSLLMLVAAWRGTRRWLYGAFALFVVFGVVAMADFWRWEYNYGHDLDPNAAIIVPGMAYQPPLIGFKQLLNFGAYSIPDIGGWLFVTVGLLLLFAVASEAGWIGRKTALRTSVAALALMTWTGCGDPAPKAIQLNSDVCSFCKMTVSDAHFGAEIVTTKGRTHTFDDLKCLMRYEQQEKELSVHSRYVHDYGANNTLIDAAKAFYVRHEEVHSPMNGNMAAFSTKEAAQAFAQKWQTEVLTWEQL